MESKKRKKRSVTSIIKRLKQDVDFWKKRESDLWEKHCDLRNEIYEINKLFPKKYFKVKYKVSSNEGYLVEKEEIKESFSLNLAIDQIKSNKTYPDTFELLDVKILN